MAERDCPATLARRLGRFVAETAIEDIPPLAMERARMCIASTIASAAVGVDIDSARIVRELEHAAGSAGASRLWFAGARTTSERAARVNAAASDAAASDDSDMRSIAHIGTIATASGLAVGEQVGASGRSVLAAMVLGYEIAGRIDEALTPGRMQRGFHGSVSTIFCGAVTTARLMGLDAEGVAHAIALAASSACGMAIAADTSCAREYHAGLAAMLGVQAAFAARAGFRADPAILEVGRGFFDAFNGQAVQDVDRDLGASWDIVTDMAFKLMPGAHPFHAIAEATWTAATEADIDPRSVSRIVVSAPQLKHWQQQAVRPHDLVGAAHSMPYFVAVALIERQVGWDLFSDRKMQDPLVGEVLARVVLDPDPPPHPDRFPHRHGGTVAIELEDGSVVRRTCNAPYGSGPRGIGWKDVDAKYRHLLAAAGRSAAAIEASLDAIHRFDTLASPAMLTDLL